MFLCLYIYSVLCFHNLFQTPNFVPAISWTLKEVNRRISYWPLSELYILGRLSGPDIHTSVHIPLYCPAVECPPLLCLSLLWVGSKSIALYFSYNYIHNWFMKYIWCYIKYKKNITGHYCTAHTISL